MTSPAKLRLAPRLALALAVTAVSTGALLVKLAHAPALSVAWYRCAFATALLALVGGRACAREWPALARREVWLVVGAGAGLGLHFATWISSLSYTSVASSIVIVNTTPLWVALLSWLTSIERVGRRTALAIGMSVVGCAVIGAGDFELAGRALLGDGLALVGAWAAALYMLAGRRLRARLSLLPYVIACYGSAAVFLLAAVLIAGEPLGGFEPATWGWLVALAVVPQVIGHSSYNYALRYVSAAITSVVALGECVGATLLDWLILGHAPAAATLVGGAIVCAGVVLALRSERT